jgi:uncharacterized protein (DUF488 family)
VTKPTTSPCTKEAHSREFASEATFYTIGHSTRSLDDFVALLRSAGVTLVVDVRTVPRSRTNPQYNREALAPGLAAHQIGYEHIAELGGLRGRQCGAAPGTNAFWQNESFHNYADYAASESFRRGLSRLRELGHRRTCAIMCAETLWWRCHRRIIADYLLAAHETVFHIIGPGQIVRAGMTKAARPDGAGTLIYPAEAEHNVARRGSKRIRRAS